MEKSLMEEFAVVGERVPRVDAKDKVTGKAQFVGDVYLPGMLYGRILRSPYPHARIRRIDASRARNLPGVRAVITAEDTPKRRWGVFIQDLYPLAVDKVRYVGDEVAAVAATAVEIAEEALKLIDVEYEELPAVFDLEEAMGADAPLIHDDKPGNIAQHIDVQRGDVEAAFARSAVVVEDTFKSTLQWHAAIETLGSVADYSPAGKLTVYMNTQTLFMARYRIAGALALNEADVRIIQPYVGGGYGGKSCDDNNAMVCSLLAMKTGRPVKLINSREDDFLASRPRVPMKCRVKMGFSKEGRIEAKHVRIIADNGAYSGKAPAVTGVATLRHDTCFQYTNVRNESFLVYTNTIPTGAFRGFGNPSINFAVDQVFDMAAEKLGIDPVELARQNAAFPGYVSPHGNRVSSCELRQCIDKAAELIGWEEKHKKRVPWRGYGFGASVHVSGKRHFRDYDGASAVVKINEDGRAMVITGEGEAGQGPLTVLSQIAAEELGVPVDHVRISMADTDLTTYCHGAYASRLTYIAGNAVKNAAAEAKRQLFETAAELLGTTPDDLESRDARIYSKTLGESGKHVTFREAAYSRLYRRGGAPILGFGSFDPDSELQDPKTRLGNESGAYNFGAQAAEVEVDPETGQVKILNYVAVSDCGTVINPTTAEGQVEGSIAHGLGYTLSEELLFENGRPLNPNFGDYKIPTAADMPPLKTAFADSYEPTGPFGAKGLGELGMDPFAAIVANAVYDAAGVRIRTLPITPEKVFWALKEKKGNGGAEKKD